MAHRLARHQEATRQLIIGHVWLINNGQADRLRAEGAASCGPSYQAAIVKLVCGRIRMSEDLVKEVAQRYRKCGA